jgi:hypothetical protein
MMIFALITGFFLVVIGVTFVTAPNRGEQVLLMRGGLARMTYFRRSDLVGYFTVGRIIKWLVMGFLLTFLWAYLTLFFDMRKMLVDRELELDVGTLKIPAFAILKSEFTADVGFSRRKRRQRVLVEVTGNVFAGFDPFIPDTGMAKLSKLTGKAFTFNFLSDVKELRPAIDAYMRVLVRNKVLSFAKIETFDNRGPYMLVILDEGRRGGDLEKEAKKIADLLFNNLTVTREMKVNQVVIKVINPADWDNNKTITVLARGQAGTYQ